MPHRHDTPASSSVGRRGPGHLGQGPRHDQREAHRHGHQGEVGGEDAAPDVVGDGRLEPVRRQRPLGPAAEVGEERAGDGHGQDRRVPTTR